MTHSLHNGRRDHSISVEQTKGNEGRRILVSMPHVCEEFVAGVTDIWEVIVSQFERFRLTANFDKAFAHCDMSEAGISRRLSQFLLAPKLSNRKRSHMAAVSNENLSNNIKYRKTAPTHLSSQILMSKVEEFLHQTAADHPPSDKLKTRLGEIANFANSAAANITPSLHDAIEKAFW